MRRLIDAEALKEEILKKRGLSWESMQNIFCITGKELDNAPTVNPYGPISEEDFYKITDAEFEAHDSFWVETPSGKKIEFEKKRPQGEWVEHRDRTYCKYGCNQCGNLVKSRSSFCPDCGAKMLRILKND